MPKKLELLNSQYKLFAFVDHISNQATAGHYIAYVKYNGTWYKFDDATILSKVQVKPRLDKAYYYCYVRIQQYTSCTVTQQPLGNNKQINQSKIPERISNKKLDEKQSKSLHQNVNQYCSSCNTNFVNFGVKFQHYGSCAGLKRHTDNIKIQLEAYLTKANEIENKKIQKVLNLEGSILKRVVEYVELINEAKLKQLQGNDYEACFQLSKELHRPEFFNQARAEIIAGPVADSEGNPVYAQWATRENLQGILGKRSRQKASTTKLARDIIKRMKLDVGVPLNLAERRDVQAANTKNILKKYQTDMLHIKNWLTKSFANNRSNQPFRKIQGMFCDGFIMPRLAKLFPKYNNLESYLRSKEIQVQNVFPAQLKGFVYVRLEDNANQFNQAFVDALDKIVLDLKQLFMAKNQAPVDVSKREEQRDNSDGSDESDEEIEEEDSTSDVFSADDIFIRQIDYTQDMLGFFMSLKVPSDINDLAKFMKMDRTRDYKSFISCFQLLNKVNYADDGEEEDFKKQLRFKVYNKWLHFLQSEQGKKKISMNLKGLLLGSNSFYQKLLQCMQEGISRLEFSSYFYSYEEQKVGMDVELFQQRIDNAFEQVNNIKGIRYEVPFKQLWKNLWKSSRSIFVFEKDIWTVVYAKNPVSTYAGQQVKVNNKKDRIDFIKRFAVPGHWSTVVDATTGKVYKVMKKGQIMQIPIQSLNCIHQQKFEFDFDDDCYKYHITIKELGEIDLVLENGEKFKFSNGIISPQQNRKRNLKRTEKSQIEEQGIDVTGLIFEKRISNKRFKFFTKQGQQLYGSICKFSSIDRGTTYKCETCSRTLIGQGKQKKPLLMFE